MSRAAGVVADACAAVIAARISASFAGLPADLVAEAAQAAVADLRLDGWHISPMPSPHQDGAHLCP